MFTSVYLFQNIIVDNGICKKSKNYFKRVDSESLEEGCITI